ncbi:uncharacterized protein LOC142234916 [Haematobia irritans]|uniref:uncharacterized protein LOC142234916 n=1 Tax=Haematobia irritans TaxID=7368 RepID=UPI003F50212A
MYKFLGTKMFLSSFPYSGISLIILISGFEYIRMAKSPVIGFKQITCNVIDKDFLIVKRCNLTKNVVGLLALSSQIHPLQSLDNVTMKASIFRKVGMNLMPFFVETTIDVCDFLQDYKRKIPWGIVYEGISKHTNINHSCPYNHDLIVENFTIPSRGLQLVPMPKGEYILTVKVFSRRQHKFTSQLVFKRY